MDGLWILLIVIGLLVFYGISLYNGIIRMIEEVKNNEAQISVQLDRRGKIFDNLINTVKKAMDYEKTALKEVIELRQKAIKLDTDGANVTDIKAVENQISKMVSSGAFASSFNMTMEAYPDLKANQNMLHFQEEIVATENKLSFAKQAFNDSIERYTGTIRQIPEVFIVNMFSSNLKEDFEYWDLEETEIKKHEERVVSFD